jgi:thioredoxin reductase (NADPH)
MTNTKIQFYGAGWCGDCVRSQKLLDQHHIEYEYLDTDANAEYAAHVEKVNKGQKRIPTIVFPDGTILVEPSDVELSEKLGLVHKPSDKHLDLAILGGGPAGLTAAIYATREGLDTTIFEKKVTGGQAATTDFIENYPGFPEGISGFELSQKMLAQAERFNTHVVSASVTGIHDEGTYKRIETDDGTYFAKGVIIAVGSEYRHSGAKGEDGLISRGIHFCATCDGPFYKNKKIAIIGAGNSAFQEGLYLTKFVSHITFIVRSDKVRASDILQKQLAGMSEKVTILYNAKVEEFVGEKRLEKMIIHNTQTNVTSDLVVDGVFVFIGLIPQTDFLKGTVDMDERGFVKTNDKLETSMPGVFVAGDCREGATAQVAAAVGDGAKAAIHVREFLQNVR